MNPHRAGSTDLLADECRVAFLLVWSQHSADPKNVVKRDAFRLRLRGSHAVHAFRSIGEIDLRLRQFLAQRKPGAAMLRAAAFDPGAKFFVQTFNLGRLIVR